MCLLLSYWKQIADTWNVRPWKVLKITEFNIAVTSVPGEERLNE